MKIMASSPVTSWQIDGENVERGSDFIFLGSKITADGDCSHEVKSHLLLGRRTMMNLDNILKSRDITLSTKIMSFGFIRSWQIVREKVETVTDFIFLGSKITVDGYCRNKFKRCLLLGRKADKPRQLIKKQRHLLTNFCIVQAMVFPVVMYRFEIWTKMKVEH